MPNEPLARAIPPPAGAPSEADYQAFCATLSGSERGRALLAEYARRNRNADTAVLLTAIERIEARLRAEGSAVQRLRDHLRMLLIAIRIVRPEIDAAGPAAAKAAKLAALLDLLERRIDAMAESAELASPPAETDADAMADEQREAARAPLAVVPPCNEPELPIPSPARFEPRSIAFGAGAPSPPAAVDNAATAPAAPPPDPLAAIMALSEDERLALFT
jgi:hypothetical protein